MKTRWIIGLAVFAVAVLAVFLLTRVSPGASYQGKSVETWARLAYAGDGRATQAFQAMGTNAVPELISLLQTKDPWYRRQLWAMQRSLRGRFGRIPPPDAVVAREGAIRALGIIGPAAREAVPALGRVLRGSDHQASADASSALALIGKAALPALLEALEDRNANVRRPAAYALAQLGPDGGGAVPALAHLLLDSDYSVRDAAAYALQAIGAPSTKILGEAMEKGDERARGAAVQALLLTTRSLRQAEPGLIKMAQSTNAVSRRMALEALGSIHIPDNPTMKTLSQGLSDPVLEVRVAAANSLANVSIRGEMAVPALQICLDDPAPELRQAAARTLGLIGTPAKAAAPKLNALLNDTNEWVRGAAREALTRVAP